MLKLKTLLIATVVTVAMNAAGCSAGNQNTDVSNRDAVTEVTDAPTDSTAEGPDSSDTDDGSDLAAADTGNDAKDGLLADSDDLTETSVEDAADSSDATDATDTIRPIDGPFHVALVADCHTLPIEYAYEPNSNVISLLQGIVRNDPETAALFALGDNIEDFFMVYEDTAAGQPVPAIETFKAMFTEFLPIPWYVVLGNHDNRFVDTFLGNDVPISRWLEYFEGTRSLPARYYSVEIGGFNFIVLFGADGAIDHATNDTNIMLNDQIAWFRSELAKGLPTVVLFHIWLDAPVESETPGTDGNAADEPAPLHPIHQAVVDFPGVIKAAFSGHGHVFKHYQFKGADFYQIGAGKSAPIDDTSGSGESGPTDVLKHFGYILCDPDTGSVTLENADQITWE